MGPVDLFNSLRFSAEQEYFSIVRQGICHSGAETACADYPYGVV
jgi:hypothetical protein